MKLNGFVKYYQMYNKRKLSIIVLAGGFGKRLSKSIGNKPKILAPIGNTTFLFYFLKWINPFLEITNCQLILSVFYKSDLIINYLNEQDLKLSIELTIKGVSKIVETELKINRLTNNIVQILGKLRLGFFFFRK